MVFYTSKSPQQPYWAYPNLYKDFVEYTPFGSRAQETMSAPKSSKKHPCKEFVRSIQLLYSCAVKDLLKSIYHSPSTQQSETEQ